MFLSALMLVEAAVKSDRGFCCFVEGASTSQPELLDLIEFDAVQFKTSGPKGRDVFDYFSEFIKECGLVLKSKTNVSYHGHTYLSWSNTACNVFFDCQYDPRYNQAKPGFAGRATFYVNKGAPARVTRKLRGALSKVCVNVPNSWGNVDPVRNNLERSRHGTDALLRRAAEVRDSEHEEQEDQEPKELRVSPEALELWELIQRGHKRISIN